DVPRVIRDTQASLSKELLPLPVDDLWIEQYEAPLGRFRVTQAASGVHDGDSQRLADLRSGDSGPRGRVEGVQEGGRPGASIGISRVNFFADSLKHRVGEEDDRSDRHD